ncbi:MAG: DNA mismatch repair protein MutS [Bdellovibrionales bacterium]
MTPLMKQYWEIKSLHPDKILFFRMGDFYELFFEDASTVAPLLGITLTSRNKKAQDETPMCGVPYHSVAGPINRLLAKGYKLAICDQIEDPKQAKGLVKRAVTRVLTPGMVYDVETLERSRAHYLASFDENSLSFLDLSTGEAFWFRRETQKDLRELLQSLPVAEIVLSEAQKMNFQLPLGSSWVLSVFEVATEVSEDEILPSSAQRLLSYVRAHNSSEALKYLRPFEERSLQGRLHLSATSLRHLEIFQNSRGEAGGTLFSLIDQSKTSAGSRRLREWMQFPLREAESLKKRWDLLDLWRGDLPRLKRVREQLSRLGDLERRMARLSQPSGSARDLLALAQGVGIAFESLHEAQIPVPSAENLRGLAQKIQQTLVEEPPLLLRQGGLIRRGVHADLDEYMTLTSDAHSILAAMEAREKESTGISSLKIRYNNVFGYYIEITHTHKDKIPTHYRRKQTLATAERFYTDELLELEKKILSAEAKRNDLEFQIFEDLKREALAQSGPISWLAGLAAELDAVTTLAWVSLEKNFVRPRISKGELKLVANRHPVVESTVPTPFVPNDILLAKSSGLLLTGPNMAGKSTLMRQVALTAILAQMGGFVPAREAWLPLYDHIFTRIGAQDQLSEGLSTFMVEMTETAELLKNSTENSLVILDEIGRGTSTYDGLSLAEAILEFLMRKKVGQVFFATHYHEITALDRKYKSLQNAHMSVVEKNGMIEFLHTLVLKPAGRSYGIQVAKLAGLPDEVLSLAQKKLATLESRESGVRNAQLGFEDLLTEGSSEATLSTPSPAVADEKDQALQALVKTIRSYRLLEKTPLETLREIESWQRQLQQL